MKHTYEEIKQFMLDYFPAYSELAQFPETQSAMDRFYAEDIMFDNGFMKGRDMWYKACVSHPGIKDIMKVNRLVIDENELAVSAWITTAPTDMETGEPIVVIDMNALYSLKETENGDLIISRIQVFQESNPEKAKKFMEAFRPKNR